MKLWSIYLKNYRQYKEAEIHFPDPFKGGISIIQGANGAGKTNLLNAITWCFYGEEAHLGIRDKGLPIINNITFSELKPNQTATISVKISMMDNNGGIEIFERKMDVIKSRNSTAELAKPQFRVSFKGKGDRDWHLSKDPEFRAEKVIPKDLQEYFLFDGERLDSYFGKGPRQGLREEVFEVSQLNLFERVIEHLEKRLGDYQKEIENVNPKADEVFRKLAIKKGQLEQAKKEKESLDKSISEAKIEEDRLAEQLKTLPISGQKLKELQTKRETYNRRLATVENDLNELRQKKLNMLLDFSKIVLGRQCLKRTKEIISNKVERGEIPPEFKKRFVERILEKGICICGSNIKIGDQRSNVEALLRQCSDIDEISQELIREDHNLEILLEKGKTFKTRLNEASKEIYRREEELKTLSEEVNEIEKIVSGIDDQRVQNLERRYKVARAEKERLIDEHGQKKQDIRFLTLEIETLEKEYDSQVKKIERHEEKKARIQFCRNCIEVSKKIMQEAMEEIREEIEKITKEQFLGTIWKKETYQSVLVDGDYGISVLDQNGIEAIGTLSAGERQFLALAFVNALHMVSGFEAPIIIDTPLGRISGEPKVNLAKALPKFTGGKQIILLMTDQEYTKEIRETMKNFVAAEYKIKFIEEEYGSRAEVKPYEG